MTAEWSVKTEIKKRSAALTDYSQITNDEVQGSDNCPLSKA